MARVDWRFRVLAGLFIALTQVAQPMHAEGVPGSINGIYRGTIGREQIVLEMGVEPPSGDNQSTGDSRDRKTYPIEGRYFYRRYGVDIRLVGMPLGDESFRLREYRRVPDDEFSAEWRLKVQGDRAVGTFCKCEMGDPSKPPGPLLKISLRRVSPEFYREFEAKDQDSYHEMLLDFPLTSGPEIEASTEIAYRMQSDPRFGVIRLQLTRFPDAGVMARINREMARELKWDRWRAAANLSEGQFGAGVGGFYDESVSVNFFLPDVLSVLVDQAWYWGGAHANQSTYSLNYSLHTGKRFRLDQALQSSAGGASAKDVAVLLGNLYLQHYVKPSDAYGGPYEKPSGEVVQMDCKEIIRESTSGKDEPFSATLYLSEKGLVIAPALSYIQKECGPPITIPYRELRPFVKPHSMLRLVVDAKASQGAQQK
ncbi:MAG TPA: hypothetical protein VI636_21505 [Candidatus Angelobacter sp.]